MKYLFKVFDFDTFYDVAIVEGKYRCFEGGKDIGWSGVYPVDDLACWVNVTEHYPLDYKE